MPTREVFVQWFKDTPEGQVGAEGVEMYFAPTRYRDGGTGGVLPSGFPLELPAGGTTIDLEVTGNDWAWAVIVSYPTGNTNGKHVRYVQVFDGTEPVDFYDLPRVDPLSLMPVEDVAPDWAAAVSEAVGTQMTTPGTTLNTALNAASVQATGASFHTGTTEPTEPTISGKPVVWLDTADPFPVTAPEPEWLGPGTFTVPTVQGVEYLVDGEPVDAGLQSAPYSGLSVVEARPLDGYTTTGRSKWVREFESLGPIIADTFAGMAANASLTGRITEQGDKTWAAPQGAMEGLGDGTLALARIGTSTTPDHLSATAAGTGAHNILDVGYTDYRIEFDQAISPSNAATVGVNVRASQESGDMGVVWRWRPWNSGPGLRLFRRVDGVSTAIDSEKPAVGLGWKGKTVVTVQGEQVSISVVVGDVTLTDTVTYGGNPESSLIRLAAYRGSVVGGAFPTISNVMVVPL